MTIIEATLLIIQTSILGYGGEIYILDMGKPYKFKDIIRKLIQLYWSENEEISIQII